MYRALFSRTRDKNRLSTYNISVAATWAPPTSRSVALAMSRRPPSVPRDPTVMKKAMGTQVLSRRASVKSRRSREMFADDNGVPVVISGELLLVDNHGASVDALRDVHGSGGIIPDFPREIQG